MENDQRFELLADLGAMIAGEVELDDMLATFAARVARALGADRATLWLIDAATATFDRAWRHCRSSRSYACRPDAAWSGTLPRRASS